MSSELDVTPAQALFILEQMIEDKKINRRDLQRYKGNLDNEIESLEKRLADLKSAVGGGRAGASSRKSAGRKRSAGKTRKRSGSKASAATQQSRALQGRYISYIRRFKGKKKEQYQKMAREKGREAAISAMEKELGK